jgi:hypothetical protein
MDTDVSTLLVVDDSAVKSRDTIATAGKIWATQCSLPQTVSRLRGGLQSGYSTWRFST